MVKNPFKTAQITIAEELRDEFKVMAAKRKTTIQRIVDRVLDAFLVSEKEKESKEKTNG